MLPETNQRGWGSYRDHVCVCSAVHCSACVGHKLPPSLSPCVCVCCPAEEVQPTRVGPVSARQPQRAGTSDEHGVPRRTNGTGIMERGPPRRRTFPSNGVRLFTSLLALCGLTCEFIQSISDVLFFPPTPFCHASFQRSCRSELSFKSPIQPSQSPETGRVPFTSKLAVF